MFFSDMVSLKEQLTGKCVAIDKSDDSLFLDSKCTQRWYPVTKPSLWYHLDLTGGGGCIGFVNDMAAVTTCNTPFRGVMKSQYKTQVRQHIDFSVYFTLSTGYECDTHFIVLKIFSIILNLGTTL